MNNVDPQYLTLVQKILHTGKRKTTRNDDGTLSIIGETMKFDLREGFPILTTKKIHFRSIVVELLWMLSGDTNIKYLVDNNVSIWTEWPHNHYCQEREKIVSKGDLFLTELNNSYPSLNLAEFSEKIRTDDVFAARWGDIGDGGYGKLFRDFKGYDQVKETFKNLKKNPFSRRHWISLWNPPALAKTLLPCCHTAHCFNCEEMTTLDRRDYVYRNYYMYPFDQDGRNPDSFEDVDMDDLNVPKIRLNLSLFCRSQDVALGTPFNITQYALMLSMYASTLNYDVGWLHWTGVDCHLYSNQIEPIKAQLGRPPYPLPKLRLNPGINDVLDFEYSDVFLDNYQYHPKIEMTVTV